MIEISVRDMEKFLRTQGISKNKAIGMVSELKRFKGCFYAREERKQSSTKLNIISFFKKARQRPGSSR